MAHSKRVTVYDLARELGLSSATVSRVLNNSVLVKDATRRRILEGAERLGYIKRTIRRQSARAIPTVALFLPRAVETYRQLFYDPASLIESIAQAFLPARVNILTAVTGQGIGGARKLGGVDGCVFAFMRPEAELAASLRAREIPFVAINRTGPDLPFVSCDHGAGMATLLSHMLATGRAVRPFYLGLRPVAEVSRLRLAALGAACAAAGVAFEPGDARELASIEDIDAAFVRRALAAGKTALVCFNDIVAITALNAARASGARVPEDLMITGFDNTPVMAVSPVRIDTIDLEVDLLGRAASQWLRDRILARKGAPIARMVAGRYMPGQTIGAGRPAGGSNDRS
jgi:LacI family transcriptional regulator